MKILLLMLAIVSGLGAQTQGSKKQLSIDTITKGPFQLGSVVRMRVTDKLETAVKPPSWIPKYNRGKIVKFKVLKSGNLKIIGSSLILRFQSGSGAVTSYWTFTKNKDTERAIQARFLKLSPYGTDALTMEFSNLQYKPFNTYYTWYQFVPVN